MILGLHVLMVNGLLASLLALVFLPWLLGSTARKHPERSHVLWVIVLLRLVLPAGFVLPVLPSFVTTGGMSGQQFDARRQAPPTADVAVRAGIAADRLSGDRIERLPPQARSSELAAPGGAWTVSTASKVSSAGHQLAGFGYGERLRALAQSGRGVLPVVWGIGAVGLLMLYLLRLGLLRRRLRRAQVLAPAALAQRVEGVAAGLGLPRTPEVRVHESPGIPPALWGWPGRPILLLPLTLLDRLPVDELEAVLVHELVHCRRHDHWIRLLEIVATCLYWWHPLVWWSRAQLRIQEERSCDRAVVDWLERRGPDARRCYARALVSTLESFSAPRLLGASALGEARAHRERLNMILDDAQAPPPSRSISRGLLYILVAALAVIPVVADSPPPAPPAPEAPPLSAIAAPRAPHPPRVPSAMVAPVAPAVVVPEPFDGTLPPTHPAVGQAFEAARQDLMEEAERTRALLDDQEARILEEVERREDEIADLRASGRLAEAERLTGELDRDRERASRLLEQARRERDVELERRERELELRRVEMKARALQDSAQRAALERDVAEQHREWAGQRLAELRQRREEEAERLAEEAEMRREELERVRSKSLEDHERRQLERELLTLERKQQIEARRLDLEAKLLAAEALRLEQDGVDREEIARRRAEAIAEHRALAEELRADMLRSGLETRLEDLRQMLVELGDDGEVEAQLEELQRSVRELVERSAADAGR